MKRLCMVLGLVGLFSVAWADVPFNNVSNMLGSPTIDAATVAWGDVNQDGRPDLFVGDGGSSGSIIYLNTGAGFGHGNVDFDASQITNVRTAQFVDYDSDGLLDIFCLTNDTRGAILYRQSSNRHFEPVDLPLEARNSEPIHSAVWTDMDGDGDLDLLLSNGPGIPTVIWLRQEGNTFSLVRNGTFAPSEGAASSICVVDYDCDHSPDLFFGYTSQNQHAKLYRNVDGRYREWQMQANLPRRCGMTGAIWTDINNDQFPDLVLPGDKYIAHLLASAPNRNSRALVDVTNMPGFGEGFYGCQTVQAADFDMDGYQDLFVISAGEVSPRLMLNHGGTSWSTQRMLVNNSGNHPIAVHACALTDYDNDGFEDIALAVGVNDVRLLHNDAGSTHEWIGLSLLGTDTPTPLPDCQVSMTFENSKRMASTSSNACAPGQDGPILYLANSSHLKSTVAELTVNWPNGEQRRYDLNSIRLNSVNRLYEPSSTGGTDMASVQKPVDAEIAITNSPNPFNPTTTINFTLPENSNVRLTVYDVLGREVTTLANAPYQAGTYHVMFAGSNLPSGLYFARLTASNETKLHRLLLLK
jgi:hypothetical protein